MNITRACLESVSAYGDWVAIFGSWATGAEDEKAICQIIDRRVLSPDIDR
jgi:hypothetical protein